MKDVKKTISKLLVKSANASAINADMKACPMFAYQPKRPKSMKKGK